MIIWATRLLSTVRLSVAQHLRPSEVDLRHELWSVEEGGTKRRGGGRGESSVKGFSVGVEYG